ncbi:putative endoglucanase [Xylaria bambusicola]|uniref:putative endoglucanase n=1 Tax=Xylaria bambusicola TaxID=326684 RepID=UPI002007D94B|nr:putative endoglucanase [Xylaria bambusicola]KAI0505242.1 putative endoglucanase [Xylaria bambusicola]
MPPSFRSVLTIAALASCQFASAQKKRQNPDDTADRYHPALTVYKCTTAGGCVANERALVIDWNYHWFHTADWLSCTTDTGSVNATLCPDQATCAENCFVQGDSNYTNNGVSTSGDTLTMYQYTINEDGEPQNASPRLYLLGDDGNYEMLQLLGKELTFTVDLSTLPCGENAALYLGEMDKTGGRNEHNTGGAKLGSGYCDAQCPVQNWKNGTLNLDGSGYCCNEMDILEANSRAHSFTPHPCSDTDCDKSGCGLNPYAQGHTNYYGLGGTVDTSKPFTVITQFITDDGTTTGTLTTVNRRYMQGGKLVDSANPKGDSITTESCNAAGTGSEKFGGLTTMGEALGRGMVLTFAIWNDASGYMNWLDAGTNGPCSETEGNPALIIQENPRTHVVFSNIRWGDIGSTFKSGAGNGSTTTKPAPTTTTSAPTATQTHYGQCGGIGYSGPKACASGFKCTKLND